MPGLKQCVIDTEDAGKFRAADAFDSVTADPCDSVHVAVPNECCVLASVSALIDPIVPCCSCQLCNWLLQHCRLHAIEFIDIGVKASQIEPVGADPDTNTPGIPPSELPNTLLADCNKVSVHDPFTFQTELID